MKKFISVFLAVITLLSALSLTGCFEEEPKVFVWNEIVLKEQLPEPNTNLGECTSNTEERLYLKVQAETETSYSAYVQACKDKGFTVDPETIGDSYDAYNAEGYKISLSNISDTIYIELEAPMKIAQITWPSAEYAKVIPVPASTVGKIQYENSEGFRIYIANTTIDEYHAYVQACSDNGFSVDYSKSDNSYRAKNAEGYSLSVSYEGFNIICIDLDCPEKSTQADSSDSTTTDSVEPDTSEPDNSVSGLRPDFKAAMDNYEKFMDEYVDFMKKYQQNPSDLSLLLDYANFMSRYTEFMNDFEAWESADMNDAETSYYIQVQLRVAQKLLEIS